MEKLTCTHNESLLTQAELASVSCFSLDELEEQDKRFFDYLKPGLFCHFEAWHKVVVYSAQGVNSTTHTDIFVYSLILGFTGGSEGACYLSAKEIAALFDYDESVIRKSIKKLLDCKLIKKLPYAKGSNVKIMAAALNHPAYRVGLSWGRGETRSRGRALAEDDPRRAQTLQFSDILREMALNATEEELSVIFTPGGDINFDKVIRLVIEGKSLAEHLNGDAARRAEEVEKTASELASKAATHLSETVSLLQPEYRPKQPQERAEGLQEGNSAPNLIDISTAPKGYRELAELASEHNGNKIRWRDSLDAYNTLVAEGYTPDEICDGYRALGVELDAAAVPDNKWPNVLAYLTSTASCAGSKGARRRMDAARERRALESAAAEAAEADRAAQEREARQAAAYEAALADLVAGNTEYATLDAEMMALIPQIRPGAAPGDPAYEAKQRLDAIARQHDALLDELKAEARRRCGIC